MITGKIIEVSLEMAGQLLAPADSAGIQQYKVLRKLLNEAKATEFGNEFGFANLLTKDQDLVNSFQASVPLLDYSELYARWWHRTIAGEEDISWPGKVKYFALSSGTSQATSKQIPVSHSMLDALRMAAVRLFSTFPDYDLPDRVYTKAWLGIGGTSRLNKVDGHYEGYLSGINARKRPMWSRLYYKPGDRIASIIDFDERSEKIAEKAPDWDVGMIIGIPHWFQIIAEKIIKRHGLKDLGEIWPNLECFVTGGVDPAPYREYIGELAGKPLTFINTYLASEGFIAFQDKPDRDDLQLILNNGIFYEFIPYRPEFFDEEGQIRGNPPAYTIQNVRTDLDYALILSTCAGAWRYHLGDIVRFTDVENGRIRITGRTKYYLNLCTEHLTGDNMSAAISQTEDELGIRIPEFMIAGIRKDNRFIHHWYVGTSNLVDPAQLKATLDNNLKKVNDDYRSEREGVLEMELDVVPVEKFYEWQMKTTQSKGGIGQTKIPRVINDTRHDEWKAFLKS